MIEQILKLRSSTFYINLGDNRMCKDVNSIYTNYGTDMIRKSQKLAYYIERVHFETRARGVVV